MQAIEFPSMPITKINKQAGSGPAIRINVLVKEQFRLDELLG